MSTRLHRSEVRRQLGRLARCGGPTIPLRAIETGLGYPLSEAGIDDLRGVIAALSAVVDATYDAVPRPLIATPETYEDECNRLANQD